MDKLKTDKALQILLYKIGGDYATCCKQIYDWVKK